MLKPNRIEETPEVEPEVEIDEIEMSNPETEGKAIGDSRMGDESERQDWKSIINRVEDLGTKVNRLLGSAELIKWMGGIMGGAIVIATTNGLMRSSDLDGELKVNTQEIRLIESEMAKVNAYIQRENSKDEEFIKAIEKLSAHLEIAEKRLPPSNQ